MKTALISLAIALPLSVCFADQALQLVPKRSESIVTLNVVTVPEGAAVSKGGVEYGASPVRLTYSAAHFEKIKNPRGCAIEVGRLVLQWPSGAVSVIPGVAMCEGSLTDYQLTAYRPSDAPNAETDERFAAQRSRARGEEPSPPSRAPQPVVQAAPSRAPTPVPQQPLVTPGAPAAPQLQALPIKQLETPGEVTLIVTTVPEGAEIFQRGVSMGRSPRKLTYDPAGLREQIREKGCAQLSALEARWPSGAISNAAGLSLCHGAETDYSWTFARPQETPGLAIDQNFSAQLALQRVQQNQVSHQASQQAQAQAELEGQRGSEALLNGLLSLIPQARTPAPVYAPEPAPSGIRHPLRCVTKKRFGRLETECD